MSSPEAVEFAEVARSLIDEPGVDQAAKRVVEYATQLTHAEHSGLTLLGSAQRFGVVAGSDQRSEKADDIQYSLHEGPGMSVTRTHQTCLVRDTARDRRWPRWGRIVAHLGLNSAVSVCLFTSRRTLGALNVYADEPDRLDDDDVERIQVLASHASVALDFMQEQYGLRQAVETRNVIGQAQGLLMERYGLDARRAFDVLRRYSQDANVKLRAVAEQLVSTRRLPDG